MKSGLVSSTWRGPTQISPLSKIAVSPTSSTGRMPKPRPAQPAIEAARMALIRALLLMGYSALGLRFQGVGRAVWIVALIVVSWEESRGGTECWSRCRYGWLQCHQKTNHNNNN